MADEQSTLADVSRTIRNIVVEDRRKHRCTAAEVALALRPDFAETLAGGVDEARRHWTSGPLEEALRKLAVGEPGPDLLRSWRDWEQAVVKRAVARVNDCASEVQSQMAVYNGDVRAGETLDAQRRASLHRDLAQLFDGLPVHDSAIDQLRKRAMTSMKIRDGADVLEAVAGRLAEIQEDLNMTGLLSDWPQMTDPNALDKVSTYLESTVGRSVGSVHSFAR